MKMKFPATVIVLMIFLQCNVFAQQITKVGPLCITVKQLDASVKFYSEVLHFKYLSTEDFFGEEQEILLGKFGIHYKVAHLQLGNEYIDLIDYLTSGGRSIPDTQKSNDLNFQHIAIVVSDMEKAFELLQKNNIEFVSTNPQTIPASNLAAAGIKAFYFHDNDNHTLELIYFPKGKGKAKWQNTNGEIFLGIDHTAIGISNTGNSLLYWKDKLMLDKKGESHNIGTEQAHLNNIKNAELQITGLAADDGPGVEFYGRRDLANLGRAAGRASRSEQCSSERISRGPASMAGCRSRSAMGAAVRGKSSGASSLRGSASRQGHWLLA